MKRFPSLFQLFYSHKHRWTSFKVGNLSDEIAAIGKQSVKLTGEFYLLFLYLTVHSRHLASNAVGENHYMYMCTHAVDGCLSDVTHTNASGQMHLLYNECTFTTYYPHRITIVDLGCA